MVWAMLASAAISAGISYSGGVAQKEAASKNALILEQAAKQRRLQSSNEREAVFGQAEQLAEAGEKYLGAQKSQIAGAGMKIDSASPLANLRKSQKNITTDLQALRSNANRIEAVGMADADKLDQNAATLRNDSNKYVTQGLLSGAASLLGGAAAANDYQKFWGNGQSTSNQGTKTRSATPGYARRRYASTNNSIYNPTTYRRYGV